MAKTSKNKKGFTAVEAILALLIALVLAGVGYVVYKHDGYKSPNSNAGLASKTTSSSLSSENSNTNNPASDDTKIVQDLASIGQAINSLSFNTSGDSALVLPSQLSKLHVNLNYNAGLYPYKILQDGGSEKNSTAVYEICASFNHNTFNISEYDTSGAMDNPGASPSSYALHSQGEQCFTNSITSEVNGVDLIANNYENQYKETINKVSTFDWSMLSDYPVDLPLNSNN